MGNIKFSPSPRNHFDLFFLLLRNFMDILKKKGILKIKQNITKFDWNTIFKNKSSWKILTYDKDNEIYVIKCDIDDCLENIGIGFGLK